MSDNSPLVQPMAPQEIKAEPILAPGYEQDLQKPGYESSIMESQPFDRTRAYAWVKDQPQFIIDPENDPRLQRCIEAARAARNKYPYAMDPALREAHIGQDLRTVMLQEYGHFNPMTTEVSEALAEMHAIRPYSSREKPEEMDSVARLKEMAKTELRLKSWERTVDEKANRLWNQLPEGWENSVADWFADKPLRLSEMKKNELVCRHSAYVMGGLLVEAGVPNYIVSGYATLEGEKVASGHAFPVSQQTSAVFESIVDDPADVYFVNVNKVDKQGILRGETLILADRYGMLHAYGTGNDGSEEAKKIAQVRQWERAGIGLPKGFESDAAKVAAFDNQIMEQQTPTARSFFGQSRYTQFQWPEADVLPEGVTTEPAKLPFDFKRASMIEAQEAEPPLATPSPLPKERKIIR